ncbi:MAG: tRNA (guanosine(37)-N1)-methyltransferase TrmD [bacterium]
MKIDILTLFPNMFDGFKTESIIKRAIDSSSCQINAIDFREFSPLNNKQVDDTIYGGGPGMLLRCEPIFECIDKIRTEDSYIIILSPEGSIFSQEKAIDLSKKKHIIFICGHYEGFDERIKTLADEKISIGKFVLTGGEIPAMMISDAVIRLLPGVINSQSLESESFNDEYYDYPCYTKPREYRGMNVPEVLINGNHAHINKWREENRKKIDF